VRALRRALLRDHTAPIARVARADRTNSLEVQPTSMTFSPCIGFLLRPQRDRGIHVRRSARRQVRRCERNEAKKEARSAE
jgi:hypothetical protein